MADDEPDYSPVPGLSGNEGMLFGLLRGLRDHLNYQDKQRAEMHEENRRDIRLLRNAVDNTAMMARSSAQWIAEEGKPMEARVDRLHGRVAALEDGRKEGAAEARGKAWVVAKIGGAVVATGAFLGWLGADKISALLFRIAVALGGGHG